MELIRKFTRRRRQAAAPEPPPSSPTAEILWAISYIKDRYGGTHEMPA